MSDCLTDEKQQKVREIQSIADETLIGDERFTELTLWQDGDFRVMVKHGFDTFESNMNRHHGERVRYKESEGKAVYEIFTDQVGDRMNIIQRKEL